MAENLVKLCVRCGLHLQIDGYDLCTREGVKTDLVTGEKDLKRTMQCRDERTTGDCGRGARHFVPKADVDSSEVPDVIDMTPPKKRGRPSGPSLTKQGIGDAESSANPKRKQRRPGRASSMSRVGK